MSARGRWGTVVVGVCGGRGAEVGGAVVAVAAGDLGCDIIDGGSRCVAAPLSLPVSPALRAPPILPLTTLCLPPPPPLLLRRKRAGAYRELVERQQRHQKLGGLAQQMSYDKQVGYNTKGLPCCVFLWVWVGGVGWWCVWVKGGVCTTPTWVAATGREAARAPPP